LARKAECERVTKETAIKVKLSLDGSGVTSVFTGLPFFDHMLELMFKHALFDVELEAQGDLEVDAHHTVEDTGLVIGCAVREALGDKRGINRFGFVLMPMDECLAEVAVDISGRPLLAYRVDIEQEPVGAFEPYLARDFLQGLVNEAGCTLHVDLREGGGVHHSLEAVFKGVGRALKMAVDLDPRVREVPSTKGSL